MLRILFSLIWFVSTIALAEPPFITDDADPADYGQAEIYLSNIFLSSTHVTFFSFPNVEIDYGILKHTEIHLIAPYVTLLSTVSPNAVGFGDFELGIKYQFLNIEKYNVQMAFAPALELPIGDYRRNLGNGKLWYSLPVWVQHSWDKWKAYGGIGYIINPGHQQENYYYGGTVLERTVTEKLMLGLEWYAQGNTTVGMDYQDFASVNLINFGGTYDFNSHFSFMASLGHSISGAKQWVGYLGLYWNLETKKKAKTQ